MPHAAPQGIAHMVFFTLADPTPENRAALVASCHEHLSGHDGVVHFSAGQRDPDLSRPVNDDRFHVALNVVFADRAAHDAYQQHPRHVEFVELNKAGWAEVRVFDARV